MRVPSPRELLCDILVEQGQIRKTARTRGFLDFFATVENRLAIVVGLESWLSASQCLSIFNQLSVRGG
jgi:hypothetical protein